MEGFNAYTMVCAVVLCVVLAAFFVLRARSAPRTLPRPHFARVDGARAALPRAVCVVGGGGFLGRAIVKELLDKRTGGDEVNVVVFDLALPPSSRRDARVTYVAGSIMETEHLAAAFRGVQTVFHVASLVPHILCPDRLMKTVNIEGTRNVIEAARAEAARMAGPVSLVYTSSATVAIAHDDWNLLDAKEAQGYPAQNIDCYTETKAVAERLVVAANGNGGLLTCSLRPTAIYGPGDVLLTDFHFVCPQNKHVLLGAGDALIDWVFVESVAHGHLCAERALRRDSGRGVAGECFFIGQGRGHTYAYMIGKGSTGDRVGWDHFNRPEPTHVPVPVAMLLARVNEAVFKLTGIALSHVLTVSTLRYVLRSYTFDCSKAKQYLGYEPVCSFDEAFQRMRHERAAGSRGPKDKAA